MNCLQVKAAYLLTGRQSAHPSLSQSSHWGASCSCPFPRPAFKHPKAFPRLVCSRARYQGSPTCLFGGMSKYENDNKIPPWNPIEKVGQYSGKGLYLHDILRKQMTEREFGGGGGSRGHRGGGGHGSGDEGEGFTGHLNELLQVILATLSFGLVYMYLIRREEMTRLSSDYVKYLLGGKPSPRLRRTMSAWGRFFDKIKGKEVKESSEDSNSTAAASPTWW